MYLKNTSNEVKELVIKINELDRDDKLKFISYVFNLWDRDQINSLSEVNPSLLDDSIDIEISEPDKFQKTWQEKAKKVCILKSIVSNYNF